MCGIVAVLPAAEGRPAPSVDDVRARMGALPPFPDPAAVDPAGLLDTLRAGLAPWEGLGECLRGAGGAHVLLNRYDLAQELRHEVKSAQDALQAVDDHLDEASARWPETLLEEVQAALVRFKDAVWAVAYDRLVFTKGLLELLGDDVAAPLPVLRAYGALHTALGALDRLEVRGRDSAGVHVWVQADDVASLERGFAQDLAERTGDELFESGAVARHPGGLSFVYKAAAAVGRLGDNGRALRRAIAGDRLLRAAVDLPGALVTVLAHTRWASVGKINEGNAHPLNQQASGLDAPYVVGVLNGDIDNHLALRAEDGIRTPEEITTDAKLIPVMLARALGRGSPVEQAFRDVVARFSGSVAVAAQAEPAGDRLLLAVRGSGQSLYVGLADDAFVVASEAYGVVGETSRYIRLEGTAAGRDGGDPGTIVAISRAGAGTLDGVARYDYRLRAWPMTPDDVRIAEVTTRDVSLGPFEHYLLKELHEAPVSFRKTLRGRIGQDNGGLLRARLGPHSVPEEVLDRLRSGEIATLLLVGQGTAAVACDGIATMWRELMPAGRVEIRALPATELSGFVLRPDMGDTCVVAVSQSDTTTDTNRTVDLARARGATVLAIVNRRDSDLAAKADGTLYTSDGRDVEMAVASTKAFYAQVAAGVILGLELAGALGGLSRQREHEILTALRGMPAQISEVFRRRADYAAVARRHATSRRHWAVVGSGPNRVAAAEVRIKLSELSYKAISQDSVEDKKHIDLSAESLVLVCASGLTGSNADDIGKEVAIFAAHRNVPVVIATEGRASFPDAADVLDVPGVHPQLAWIMSTVAGHVFAYECARAIDEAADPLRLALARLQSVSPSSLHEVRRDLRAAADVDLAPFWPRMQSGDLDGCLGNARALRLANLRWFADGVVSLDSYADVVGRPPSPRVLLEDFQEALTQAVDEMTRPIDSVKHQAKTVTVGISRSEEETETCPLVQAVLERGVDRRHLPYKVLRALVTLAPAVEQVDGATRYRLVRDTTHPTLEVVGQDGVAAGIRSRVERDPRLRGTKQWVASEQEVLLSRGRSDGRLTLLVPEIAGRTTVGISLLHVTLRDRLDTATLRNVLEGYQDRYAKLWAAVTETRPVFDDERLGAFDVESLLTCPVESLADSWAPAAAATRRVSGAPPVAFHSPVEDPPGP